MRYAFIRDQAETHHIARLCAPLGVSHSGYYAWRERPLSARREADQRLLPLPRLHRQTREQYGAVKLWHRVSTLKNERIHHRTYQTVTTRVRTSLRSSKGFTIVSGRVKASATSVGRSSHDGSVTRNSVSTEPGLAHRFILGVRKS